MWIIRVLTMQKQFELLDRQMENCADWLTVNHSLTEADYEADA